VSCIVYALPALSGCLSEYNRSRINAVFKKGRKWCITDLSFTTEELIDTYDQDPLLPPSKPDNYMFNLRPRGSDLSCPSIKRPYLKIGLFYVQV